MPAGVAKVAGILNDDGVLEVARWVVGLVHLNLIVKLFQLFTPSLVSRFPRSRHPRRPPPRACPAQEACPCSANLSGSSASQSANSSTTVFPRTFMEVDI